MATPYGYIIGRTAPDSESALEGRPPVGGEIDMDMRLICALIMLGVLQHCSAETLSTTPDGSLQAIAQGPDTIALYWRHEGRSAPICVNGRPCGEFEPNPAGPYCCKSITSLLPNTYYTFTVGESSPAVVERTWAKLPAQESFDVLVIGGTASGLAAAVTAARAGLKVALVESTNRLGGMSVNGLGHSDMRNKATTNGFFNEFRERVIEFYGGGTGFNFEPRAANAILKNMAYEQSCLSVFMRAEVVGAMREGDCVRGAEVCDLLTGRKGRLFAKVIIDATDCADLAAAVGAENRIGREPRTECEPHAGFIYFDDKTQTILPGSTGCADAKVQSYAYLMVWKDYGEKPAPLVEKPEGYDPEDYIYSPEWPKTWNFTSGKLPNDKYEINQHPFGTDKPGINFDYPCASRERRCQIDKMYRDRALGYLYFMQNERGHKNLGLADDEFLDSANFPPGLYVREARRVMGEHLAYECEVTNARQYFHADSIAIAEYPMDSHAMEELKAPDDRLDKGEGEDVPIDLHAVEPGAFWGDSAETHRGAAGYDSRLRDTRGLRNASAGTGSDVNGSGGGRGGISLDHAGGKPEARQSGMGSGQNPLAARLHLLVL